jgi:hypothetical protein
MLQRSGCRPASPRCLSLPMALLRPARPISGWTGSGASADRTLSACNEGTPSIDRISLGADLDSSWVELGFHYHRDCRVDRQALGTLTGFRTWTAARYLELDAAVERAAAAVGEQVRGNIGDRDHLRYLGRDYDLIEAQGRRGDFATWRIYLHDRATGTAERLEVMTHRGSTAFANPTATVLRDPTGRDALLVTLFLPMEGAAPGEAGSLLQSSPSARPAWPPARARRSARPDAVRRR